MTELLFICGVALIQVGASHIALVSHEWRPTLREILTDINFYSALAVIAIGAGMIGIVLFKR